MLDSISAPAGGPALAATPNRFADLSSEEFIKIIFTELGQQDPLQPSDTGALLEQLSSLRSIQADIELSSRLETLVMQNEMAAASGLIGKYVSGITPDAQRVEDFVLSVSRTQDGPVLNLQSGMRVPMRNVDEILDVEQLKPGGTA
jgi:flagellar basal-body rod modification protein FlgD